MLTAHNSKKNQEQQNFSTENGVLLLEILEAEIMLVMKNPAVVSSEKYCGGKKGFQWLFSVLRNISFVMNNALLIYLNDFYKTMKAN